MTDALTVAAVVSGLATAVVGGFVAYQSYRGYRRNGSRPMLALAVGVSLLTTVAFVVERLLTAFGTVGPVYGELAFQAVSIVGILVVLYALTRA